MQVTKTLIEGILVIEPIVHNDSRGFFLESFNENRYNSIGVQDVFVKDNFSR